MHQANLYAVWLLWLSLPKVETSFFGPAGKLFWCARGWVRDLLGSNQSYEENLDDFVSVFSHPVHASLSNSYKFFFFAYILDYFFCQGKTFTKK